MLRIAICDDEPAQRAGIRAQVSDHLASRGLTFQVKDFSAGASLVREVADGEPFDLYLLDVLMPEPDGIQCALAIRERDERGLIVFLTSSPDFALEGYRARAFDYLVKPVAPARLRAVLDDALARVRDHAADLMPVRTRSGVVLVPADALLYAELRGRRACYVLESAEPLESPTLTTSFRDVIAPLLADGRFVMCGASFAVNVARVRMVGTDGVTFMNGVHVHLPRSACASLRRAWSAWWLGGEAP